MNIDNILMFSSFKCFKASDGGILISSYLTNSFNFWKRDFFGIVFTRKSMKRPKLDMNLSSDKNSFFLLTNNFLTYYIFIFKLLFAFWVSCVFQISSPNFPSYIPSLFFSYFSKNLLFDILIYYFRSLTTIQYLMSDP